MKSEGVHWHKSLVIYSFDLPFAEEPIHILLLKVSRDKTSEMITASASLCQDEWIYLVNASDMLEVTEADTRDAEGKENRGEMMMSLFCYEVENKTTEFNSDFLSHTAPCWAKTAVTCKSRQCF